MVTAADFRSLPDYRLFEVGAQIHRSYLLDNVLHSATFARRSDGWVLVEVRRV